MAAGMEYAPVDTPDRIIGTLCGLVMVVRCLAVQHAMNSDDPDGWLKLMRETGLRGLARPADDGCPDEMLDAMHAAFAQALAPLEA